MPYTTAGPENSAAIRIHYKDHGPGCPGDEGFLDRSCNVDLLGGSRVSDQAWQNSFYAAVSASAHAALGCVTACREDFRGDLATISIPVLAIHRDQDRPQGWSDNGRAD